MTPLDFIQNNIKEWRKTFKAEFNCYEDDINGFVLEIDPKIISPNWVSVERNFFIIAGRLFPDKNFVTMLK